MKLRIPRPCTENWQAMQPSSQGRYCHQCEKTVIDFTGMTDAQVKTFLQKKTAKAICGRLRTDQLNRRILKAKPSGFASWPIAAVMALLAPLLAKSQQTELATSSFATTNYPLTASQQPGQEETKLHQAKPADSVRIISGKVVSVIDFMELPGVSIRIKGRNTGVNSDINGRFQIEAAEGDILKFSYVGFLPQEVPIIHARSYLEIALEEDVKKLAGEVIVINYRWYTPRNLWHRLKSLFR